MVKLSANQETPARTSKQLSVFLGNMDTCVVRSYLDDRQGLFIPKVSIAFWPPFRISEKAI